MADSTIPILDCSKIQGKLEDIGDSEGFKEFTENLDQALKTKGIMYLTNHGLDFKLVDALYEKSLEFFNLPDDVKDKYRKPDAVQNFHGFCHLEDECLHENGVFQPYDHNEAFDSWIQDAYEESKYPEETPGLKKAFDDLRPVLNDLTVKLLRSSALILNLEDPDFLINKHKHLMDSKVDTQHIVRASHYPPIQDLEGRGENFYRMVPHADWGTYTFMFPNQEDGFEAQDRGTGEWFPVPKVKDAIILIPVLALENWAGGNLLAMRHRVIFDKETAHLARQSYDFYVQPDGDAVCTPVVKEHPGWKPIYPKKKPGQTHYSYFQERVRRTRRRYPSENREYFPNQ